MITADPAAACPNCGVARVGRYCPACGQDNRHARLRLRDWLADGVETLFSVDSRWLRTVRELSFDPGGVVRRYVGGQRVHYVAPVRYALVTGAIWWVVVMAQLPDLSDPAIPPGLRLMLLYGQPVNLTMLPLLAVVLWLVFLGTGVGYAAHLCFVLFTCAHVFLWRAGLAGLGAWLPHWGPSLNTVDVVLFTGYMACAAWFWQRPMGRQPWWKVGLLLLRIGLSVFLVFVASGVLMRWAIRVLSWLAGSPS